VVPVIPVDELDTLHEIAEAEIHQTPAITRTLATTIGETPMVQVDQMVDTIQQLQEPS
jgi:hypothetical protein